MRLLRQIRFLGWALLGLGVVAVLIARAVGAYHARQIVVVVPLLFFDCGVCLILEAIWAFTTGKVYTRGGSPLGKDHLTYWLMVLLFVVGGLIGFIEAAKRLFAFARN